MTAIDQTTANFTRVAPLEGMSAFVGTEAWKGDIGLTPPWSLKAMVLRMLGGCMVLASTGLWLVEGAGSDPEMALVRIGLSVVLLFTGLVLMLINDPSGQPSVQFDLAARKVRIVMQGKNRDKVLEQHGFDRLGGVRFSAKGLQLFKADGMLLIEVPMADAASRSLLDQQLGNHLPRLA